MKASNLDALQTFACLLLTIVVFGGACWSLDKLIGWAGLPRGTITDQQVE